MHYYFTALSLTAGICLGFGLLYLFIALRRRQNKALYLFFALFALGYAGTLFNGRRWYSTTSVTEFIAINRFDQIFVGAAFISLIWYIAYYTDVRPRVFLWGLSAAIIVPHVIYIVSPMTVYGEILGLTYIELPWGERLANLDATGSVWFDLILFARLTLLGYMIFALIRQFRRGERQPHDDLFVRGIGLDRQQPFFLKHVADAPDGPHERDEPMDLEGWSPRRALQQTFECT